MGTRAMGNLRGGTNALEGSSGARSLPRTRESAAALFGRAEPGGSTSRRGGAPDLEPAAFQLFHHRRVPREDLRVQPAEPCGHFGHVAVERVADLLRRR